MGAIIGAGAAGWHNQGEGAAIGAGAGAAAGIIGVLLTRGKPTYHPPGTGSHFPRGKSDSGFDGPRAAGLPLRRARRLSSAADRSVCTAQASASLLWGWLSGYGPVYGPYYGRYPYYYGPSIGIGFGGFYGGRFHGRFR